MDATLTRNWTLHQPAIGRTELAVALAQLAPDQWLTQAERFRALLESHVVEKLIAQASWGDPKLRFSHYREDQVELDLDIYCTKWYTSPMRRVFRTRTFSRSMENGAD